MAEATWKDTMIAKSNHIIEIEGSAYFPPEDVALSYLIPTSVTTRCPWKGNATYFNIVVNNEVLEGAAWSYQYPKSKAQRIKKYIAFWMEVVVVK